MTIKISKDYQGILKQRKLWQTAQNTLITKNKMTSKKSLICPYISCSHVLCIINDLQLNPLLITSLTM